MGYRCKYEYDVKAVLLFSASQLLVLTYTLESLGESHYASFLKPAKRKSSERSDSGDDPDTEANLVNSKSYKQADIILKWEAGPTERIIYCRFADDERPHFIFILLENTITYE